MQSADGRRDETRTGPKSTGDALPPPSQSAWRVPPLVQRLFDRFPLLVYPANELPLRAPKTRTQNVLYIFTTNADAALGAPSFNPGCLKWQALLSFRSIDIRTVPSCNHASPSGALPFLLPAANSSSFSAQSSSPDPIPTSKLESWILSHNSTNSAPAPADPALTTYSALLSHPIRLAYLYALYLHPGTFTSTATTLYIAPSSRSPLVRRALEYPLRAAALSELLSTSSGPVPRVDAERLLREADEAFDALSTLLGDAIWFGSGAASTSTHTTKPSRASAPRRAARKRATSSQHAAAVPDELDEGSQQRNSGFGLFDDGDDGDEEAELTYAPDGGSHQQDERPGILDAALFAYTHVILLLFADQEAGSPARRLYEYVDKRRNLVDHRERILRRYFTAYWDSREAGGGRGSAQ